MIGDSHPAKKLIAWAPCIGMLAVMATMLVGCQQKMADQPSFRPDQPASFLPDGTSSQHPVAGTVPRGHLQIDLALFTGKRTANAIPIFPPANATLFSNPPTAANPNANAAANPNANAAATPTNGNVQTLLAAELANYQNVVNEFPVPVDEAFVEHGYHRFMIYCVVCHDALGTGQGKIVERGYTRPPSYHIQRLRDAPVGHFFRVITEGYGSMPSYAAQIPVRDRWAIVAYIRALQLSQHCPANESPEKAPEQPQSGPSLSMTTEHSP
jgi:mono/diheme cytochrome c family protein